MAKSVWTPLLRTLCLDKALHAAAYTNILQFLCPFGAKRQAHKEIVLPVWCGRTCLTCTELYLTPNPPNTFWDELVADCEPGLIAQISVGPH